jgi:quinol monooxygenase YgiN
MITRIYQFESAEGKSEELHAFLKSLEPYILNSKGSVSYEVLRSTTSGSNFVVLERWDNEDCHKESLANFPKEEMMAAMPLFKTEPKGDYFSH